VSAEGGSAGGALPGVVDSHCHLQSLPADGLDGILDRARARGVAGFLVPAVRLEEADALLALCARHRDVWCALGVHPHEAAGWRDGDARRLEALIRHPAVVAVGECGLDFHYDHAPRPLQERAFREQCEVAIAAGLPVVVHNRESEAAMLDLLAAPELAPLRADFHSYSGGRAMAERLLARDRAAGGQEGPVRGGSWFGVSGMVTFRKADNVREALPLVPPDRLLVETDSPYLAPVPHRGKPNEPAWVVEVALRLAEELRREPADVAALTTANFFALFPKARG
jgi:TatD DNase family protein